MTVLTSTGNVNLTSATNWSPSQIPVNGDDLIIGAHTLTLDADLTLDSVTFNSSASRLAISGTTRSVQATNGWTVSASISAVLCSTVLTTGTTVTLTGAWNIGTTASLNIAGIFSSTGGNATLRTVGSNQSSVLFVTATGNVTRRITNSWTGGNLTTIGRFNFGSGWTSNEPIIINFSSGTYTHQSSGVNDLGGATSQNLFQFSGNSTLNWTGSVVSQSITTVGGIFSLATSSVLHAIGAAGDTYELSNATGSGTTPTGIISISAGAVVLTGVFSSTNNGIALRQTGGTVTYVNQTLTLPPNRYFVVDGTGGTLNVSGLRLTSSKGFLIRSIGAHAITSNADTQFICSSTAAMFAVYFNPTLESRFVVLPADPPTLPPQNKVEVGQVYGYAATPLTGTGLIVDSGVLSTSLGLALTANNIATRTDVTNAALAR